MKKNQQRPPGQRKKKTNDQIRKENRERDRERAEQKQKDVHLRWEELKSLHNSCKEYLQLPARVAPFLRNEEMMNKVSSPAELKRLASIMSRDVETYADELNKIEGEWMNRTGRADEGDEVMEAILIGQKYDNWYHSFTNVVMPNLIEITEMINEILPQNQKIEVNDNAQ